VPSTSNSVDVNSIAPVGPWATWQFQLSSTENPGLNMEGVADEHSSLAVYVRLSETVEASSVEVYNAIIALTERSKLLVSANS
jgi:hypothetical protein